jgi:iron complex outermembrane receptor protein
MRSTSVIALAAILASSAAVASPACSVGEDAAPRDISIPAQSLDKALQALAAQTGIDVLFEPATVAGLDVTAVKGRMSPGEALCRLLRGSALEFAVNADHTIIIRKPSLFTEKIAALDRSVRTVTMALETQGVPSAPAPEKLPAAAAEAERHGSSPAEEIVVTGTRRSNRTIADSPVPIDVIGAEVLQNVGSTDTNKALSMLVPSFNFPQPSITGGTDIIRPATLRGLGPDQTLVLVNGKRRHVSALLNINGTVGRGSAAVDMSLLPVNSIQRIEVLRDGAAAQYGSDAIAGVLNVLLKDNREGGNLSVTYGETYTTVEGARQATGVVLQPNGQPLLTPDGVFALNYGGDREAHDGEALTVAGDIGLPLGREGFVNVSAQLRDRDPTNRAGYDPRPQYPRLPNGQYDPRELTFDRLSHRFGEAKIEDWSAIVNAGTPLAGGALEWYGFGTYGERDGRTQGFYRQANDARTVTSLWPNGFLAQVLIDLSDYAAASGLRGTAFDWKYDASLNFGHNGFDFVTANSDNASLGAASPTRFDAGGLRYEQQAANLDVQREFDVGGLSKPLSIAFGLEYRNERFQVQAGEPASYIQGPVLLPSGQAAAAGAQVFPGFRPDNATDRERHSSSLYVDVEADVTNRWNLTLAGRGEDYSDFGSDFNYKLATRFEVMNGLALRGGVSTGFRAPSLHQQFFSTTSTNNIAGRLVDVGTFAVTDGAARALGARDLEPETSFNISAGLVFDLIDRLNVTVDYYRIDIDDRIVLTENLGTSGTAAQNAAVQGLLASAGYTSISSARFFINGLDTRTNGVDVVTTYRFPSYGVGDFRLTAGYNYTETQIQRFINELGPLAQVAGVELFGRLESERIERGQPRSKLALSMDWTRNALGATLRANRYGEVFAPGVDPRDDLTIEPAWVVDLELRFDAKHFQLALGAENLLDEYPTHAPTGVRPAELGGNYTVNNYILPYSGFSPFGFSGRFLYGRATYRFGR